MPIDPTDTPLRNDVPIMEPVKRAGWALPTDADGFLKLLAQTPAFGKSDRARVYAFLKLPAARSMPEKLHDELDARGLLD